MGSEHVLREQLVILVIAFSQALKAAGQTRPPDTGLVGYLVFCQLARPVAIC